MNRAISLDIDEYTKPNAMKISVIMPSYLGYYDGGAAERPEKFKRAVRSFLAQEWQGSELIIVADGCAETERIFSESWWPAELEEFEQLGYPIRLVTIDKQAHFSGVVRNKGIEAATGEVICYLDNDDVLMHGHLQGVWSAFQVNERDPAGYRRWVYYNDFLAAPDLTIARERESHLAYGGIGTSCFAHEKSLGVRWSNGYGHDWLFVQRLMEACPHTKKVSGPRYLVCHVVPHPGY